MADIKEAVENDDGRNEESLENSELLNSSSFLNESTETNGEREHEEENGEKESFHEEENGEKESFHEVENEADEKLDDSKVDVDAFDFIGRCDICGAGLLEGKDHMEFLLDRLVIPSKEGPYRRFIAKHWPDFSQYSLKMQPFCHVCKLHFWGLPDFFRHVLNMAKLGVEHLPEQYFKADSDSADLEREIEGMERHSLMKRDREKVHRLLDGAIRVEGKFFFPPKKDEPSEEEKEQRMQDHAPILENVLELMHAVEDGEAKKEIIGLLEPLICKCSPRWFVSSYLSGKYETSETDVEVDNSAMLKTREPGAMDTGMHLHTALADLLAKRAMGELTHDEYNERVRNLTGPAGVEERRRELEKKMEERRALSGGNAQGTPIKCMRCDEEIVNLRWHLEDVLWFRDYERTQHKAHRGRWDHVRNYFGEKEAERLQAIASCEETNPVTPKCPACNLHFRSARGIQHLLYHVQTSAFVQGGSEYKQKHLAVADRITQDVIDARAGVLGRSVTDIVDGLIEYLTCKEGGFYSYRVVRHLHVLRRHAELKNRLKRRRDGMESDRGMIKKSRGRFSSGRLSGQGLSGAPPPGNSRSMSFGSRPFSSGQVGVYCELCSQEFYGMTFQEANSYLHAHLVDMIFKARKSGARGSLNAVATHLSCFPREFVYSKRCRCPNCGQSCSSLDHALNHICVMAASAGMKAQPHMQAANHFVSKYIECMSGAISLSQLTTLIRHAFDFQS